MTVRIVEYRVRWRRQGWAHVAQRMFSERPAADRLVAKLRNNGRPDLAPIIELRVDVRPVGAWSELERIIDDDDYGLL